MKDNFRDEAEADPAKREPQRDKRAAFVRLAEKRTKTVLEKIRVLSNLSNHHVYEFYEDDIDEIFEAIERDLGLARARFEARKRRKPEFKLSRREDERQG